MDVYGHVQTVNKSMVNLNVVQVSDSIACEYLLIINVVLGDCGAEKNGFGMTCNGIGGQPPATLAEFTLGGTVGTDYYDLSNVDGHTISMTIRPIPGQFTSVNNPSLGKYNCGTVSYFEDYQT